ncbi:hypothetical protein BGX33_005278, partial [Mortierella sp. NVP41]
QPEKQGLLDHRIPLPRAHGDPLVERVQSEGWYQSRVTLQPKDTTVADRYTQPEEVLHLQVKKHYHSSQQESHIQHEQRREQEGRHIPPVVARPGQRAIPPQEERKPKDIPSNSSSEKDKGSGKQQQEQRGHNRIEKVSTTTTSGSQSTSKRTGERIKAKVSSLAASARASIPKAPKAIKDNRNNKSNKGAKSAKAKHPNEVKNQRGGFKSTQERKQAQLIPVLDEHGVTIEDHFISPRDTDGDGDGVPDYYVLLRPSTDNSMVEMGLFDDDVTAVPAPPAPPVILAAAIPVPPPPVVP